MPSKLVAFYRDGATDHAGRTFEKLIQFTPEELEGVHDFIQWLFPLPEASKYNPEAPVLTGRDVEELLEAPDFGPRLSLATSVLLAFYGLYSVGGRGTVKVALLPHRSARVREWMREGDHNLLRVSRILRCLTIFEHKDQAEALLEALIRINAEIGNPVPERTIQFWLGAVNKPVDL